MNDTPPTLTEDEVLREIESRRYGVTYHPYGYGIVDKDGKPWWDENCVWKDLEIMQDICEGMNDVSGSRNKGYCCSASRNIDPRAPYRVVRLYWREEEH